MAEVGKVERHRLTAGLGEAGEDLEFEVPWGYITRYCVKISKSVYSGVKV